MKQDNCRLKSPEQWMAHRLWHECPLEQTNARNPVNKLVPVSEAPAIQTRANWAALLPDDVPMVGERVYG